MPASNKMTKAQIISALVETCGLDKKSVASVLDGLANLAARQLGPDGPGEITIPGLVKLKSKATPASADRQGTHPFTKEPILIKGKPASRKVRATPVKHLKDQVA